MSVSEPPLSPWVVPLAIAPLRPVNDYGNTMIKRRAAPAGDLLKFYIGLVEGVAL